MEDTKDFNTLYDENSEQILNDRLMSLCGTESFRPKLDHLKELLANEVRELEAKAQVVVIGGTNGKGGSCHHLKNLLHINNYKVGLWTSPHVLSVKERFFHSHNNITYEELNSLIDQYLQSCRDNKLSFYEFLFFLFIKWVNKKEIDVLILEVGLGGRFDGVNIFTKPLTAITSISLDHTEILGKDLKSILYEKYGITRLGERLVSAVEQDFLKSLLESWCERDEIELYEIERHNFSYEINNQRLALKLYSLLNLIPVDEKRRDDYLHRILPSQSKGRREKMTINDRDFIFIGAHNIDGHRKMLAELYHLEQKSIIFVLGFSTGKEKDLENIINLFSKYPCLSDEIYLANFEHPRAINKELLKEVANKFDLSFIESCGDKWEEILYNDLYKNKEIIISGSYFFIGQWQKYLLSHLH